MTKQIEPIHNRNVNDLLIKKVKPDKHSITAETKIEIRQLLKKRTIPHKEIARRLGVSTWTVGNIARQIKKVNGYKQEIV